MVKARKGKGYREGTDIFENLCIKKLPFCTLNVILGKRYRVSYVYYWFKPIPFFLTIGSTVGGGWPLLPPLATSVDVYAHDFVCILTAEYNL